MARRLIYLDEAIKEIEHDYDALYWNTDKALHAPGVELAITALESVETIDPVKHGQWLGQIGSGFTPGGNAVYFCSECKWIFGSHRVFPNYKYCPNCGSRMDGDENEVKHRSND